MPVAGRRQKGFFHELREVRGNSQCKGPVLLTAILHGWQLKKFFFNLFFVCAGSSLLHGLFSSCGEQGLFSSCETRVSHCSGFSC